MLTDDFFDFLAKAKKNTYASGRAPDSSSRPASHDLTYEDGDFLYIDTYLGGFAFVGEEAVWQAGAPVWGMNYYGKMLCPDIPGGFSHFLKAALLQVSRDIPYRGPQQYAEHNFLYKCAFTGDRACFKGEEVIFLDGIPIYRLEFHGGEVI